jgi:ParB-like chromosome segregation protein Spo0J
MTAYTITLIDTARLRPTEQVEPARVAALVAELAADACQRLPILVEETSLAILDGHHRFRAAQALGLARIAAILIGYGDPRLTLASWTAREFVPEDVIAAARTGRLLPQKSTRHILAPAAADIAVPLDLLREAALA